MTEAEATLRGRACMRDLQRRSAGEASGNWHDAMGGTALATQRVQRRFGLLRGALLALEVLVLIFAMIFFALLIEYTETAFRIVPLRALQLTVSLLLLYGLRRLSGMLARAYEYRFDRDRLAVIDVRRPKHPVPLWSLDPDAIVDWGRVGQASFQRLLEDGAVLRHPYFVHRGAELYYIHYCDRSGEGMAVIEPGEAVLHLLSEIAPGKQSCG